jgi:hypothetical protein
METESVRIRIRSRYGRAAQFLGSLKVVSAADVLIVYIFDLPAPARIYAWLSPVTGKVMIVPHGGDVRSPKDAVAHASARELGA